VVVIIACCLANQDQQQQKKKQGKGVGQFKQGAQRNKVGSKANGKLNSSHKKKGSGAKNKKKAKTSPPPKNPTKIGNAKNKTKKSTTRRSGSKNSTPKLTSTSVPMSDNSKLAMGANGPDPAKNGDQIPSNPEKNDDGMHGMEKSVIPNVVEPVDDFVIAKEPDLMTAAVMPPDFAESGQPMERPPLSEPQKTSDFNEASIIA